MRLKTLSQLADEHGTDKGPMFHNYTEFYQELLSPIRHLPITMLEIGVLGGHSLRMWDGFFDNENTQIYGADIHDREIPESGKIRIRIGDATNPNFLYDLTQETGPIDLIVDDGSHFSSHQKDSLRLLWPSLSPGGLYIVEDCHSSYFYPWTKEDEVSFISSTSSWIDRLNEKGAGHCGRPTETDVEQIIFRKSLVVIKKR